VRALPDPSRPAWPVGPFRRADVLDASASGAQLAASVSLVLAAGKIRDHVVDRDGAYARRLVAAGVGLAAGRWLAAGRPGNAEPLAEAGRHFGRIAHLLDAAEDLADDEAAGSYNPQARLLCADAVAGLRHSVASLELDRPTLAESLLAGEVGLAVDRVFRQILRDNGLVSANWPPSPPGPGGPGYPGGPGPGGPGGDRPPGTEDPSQQQPGPYDQMPGDVFKPAPWQQGNNPGQWRPQAVPPSGGECCFSFLRRPGVLRRLLRDVRLRLKGVCLPSRRAGG
jgi:hypothetical protein